MGIPQITFIDPTTAKIAATASAVKWIVKSMIFGWCKWWCTALVVAAIAATASRWQVQITAAFRIIVQWPLERWHIGTAAHAACTISTRRRLVIVVSFRRTRRIVIDTLLLWWPIVRRRSNGCIETRWWWWLKATITRIAFAINFTISIIIWWRCGCWPLYRPFRLFNPKIKRTKCFV